MTTMPWLKALEVRSFSAGTIVAFGDSITDGTCGTLDAHDRWEDWLAVRLALANGRRGDRETYKAVINEGIGGNTVTREGLQPPPDSAPGLERLDRDVLSHEGVTDVVVFMGTNDIRRGAPAAQLIGGMTEIARRIKARGIKVFGATIIPRHNVASTGTNSGWNDAKTAVRREVNQWIRAHRSFDGVLDFDAVVRDPGNADLILPAFDCDGIAPDAAWLSRDRSFGRAGNVRTLTVFSPLPPAQHPLVQKASSTGSGSAAGDASSPARIHTRSRGAWARCRRAP